MSYVSDKRYSVRYGDGSLCEEHFARVALARKHLRDSRRGGNVEIFERGKYRVVATVQTKEQR